MTQGGGVQGGRLLLAAGAFTLVNNYLPGSEHLDLAVLNSLGVAAVALGVGARSTAARHSSTARPFRLAGTLEQTVRSVEAVSERHRIVLEAPEPLVGLGDPTGVHHVVMQLLENAVKDSPRGGTVTLSARREGGFAVVEVSDEGIGVPPDQEESLFTPFFQAGTTNTREYDGIGLGLYIVRQLVEAQGGTVTAANRPTGGTCVRFTVPLSARPAATARRADSPVVAPSG